jgi:Raf kinase inhibitor-like YbhB/YbcL family protein
MNLLIVILMSLTLNKTLTVTSTAFAMDAQIPSKYTCDGKNINPELSISNLPKGTITLALIIEDPDAPKGTFDHWVMWNIPPSSKISENSAPGAQGQNGNKENKYYGPCPPSGTHHYHFKLYALDSELNLPGSTNKKELLEAMEGHILAQAELIGLYSRQ